MTALELLPILMGGFPVRPSDPDDLTTLEAQD